MSESPALAMGGGGGGGVDANTIPRAGGKSKQSARRKSLSLDKSPLDRLRTTERRGSFAAPSSLSAGGLPPHEKPERRGSIVHRWFRHISEAAEAYKTREGKNRGRPEPAASSQPLTPPTTDIDSTEPSQEKTKESEESPSEAPKPVSSDSNDLDSSATSTGTNDVTASSDANASAMLDTTDAVAKKLGGGEPCARRPEPLRLLTEESPLVQPSEVVVSQRSVLRAEPVLTPIERLRRQDEAIRLALSEKQQLVADILHVPREEFQTIAELAGEPSVDKDASELVLAAVNQANQLTSVLNDTLLITMETAMGVTSEVHASGSPRAGHRASRLPGVPTYKIQSISDALNMQLTELLKIIKHRDEEREQLRRELQKHREQIHAMHHKNHLSAASPAHSRPSSCVSAASDHSEDDTGLQSLALVKSGAADDGPTVAPSSDEVTEPHEEVATDEFVDALTCVEAELREGLEPVTAGSETAGSETVVEGDTTASAEGETDSAGV